MILHLLGIVCILEVSMIFMKNYHVTNSSNQAKSLVKQAESKIS